MVRGKFKTISKITLLAFTINLLSTSSINIFAKTATKETAVTEIAQKDNKKIYGMYDSNKDSEATYKLLNEKNTEVENFEENEYEDTIVNIPDEKLKYKINVALSNYPFDSNITREQLKGLVKLDAFNAGITNLEGLQYAENLEDLNLGYNNISDFSIFANNAFPKLKALNLSGNNIEDLSIFENSDFSNLITLELQNNNISDLAPIKNMNFKELKKLILSTNKVEILEGFSEENFPKIEQLHLQENLICDISFLENVSLPNLVYLYLSNNKIKDISPLEKSNFPKLQYLMLNNNEIEDINSISKFNYDELRTFYLSGNNIKDISPINYVNFPNIYDIDLSNNNISSLNLYNFQGIGNISYFSIGGQEIQTSSYDVEQGGTLSIDNVIKELNGVNVTQITPINGVYNINSNKVIWSDIWEENNLKYEFRQQIVLQLPNKKIKTYFSGRVNVPINIVDSNIVDIPDNNLKKAINKELGRAENDFIRISDLESLDSLSASYENISNLEGLQYAINLEYLNLSNNNISDISILSSSKFEKLATVYLDYNNIADISSITEYNFPNLKKLNVTNQNITLDKNTVEMFDDIEIDNFIKDKNGYIRNGISVKNGVFKNNKIKWINIEDDENLEFTYNTDIQIGNSNISFSGKATMEIEVYVNIPDDNLRATINKTWSRESNTPITLREMESLWRISGDNSNINNLEGIQYAKNLEGLYLDNNNISDISIFKNMSLPKLSSLSLSYNNIVDITPLASFDFPMIEYLDLDNNKITNLNAFSNKEFKKLNTLRLYNNEINDISALETINAPYMQVLDLNNNNISNLNAFIKGDFYNLKELNLNYNEINDITALQKSDFRSLKYLYLRGQKVTLDPVECINGESISVVNPIVGSKGNIIKPSYINYGYYDEKSNSVYNEYIHDDEKIEWYFSENISISSGWNNVCTYFDGDVIVPIKILDENMIIDIPDDNFKKALNEAFYQDENDDITLKQMRELKNLFAYEMEIENIEGIQYATNLEYANLHSNNISDLSILKKCSFKNLQYLFLHNNSISNISWLRELDIPNIVSLSLDNQNIKADSVKVNAGETVKVENRIVGINDDKITEITAINGYYNISENKVIFKNVSNTFNAQYKFDKFIDYNNILIRFSGKVMTPIIVNKAPVINVKDIVINIGDNFNYMDGVTANDDEDGDLTEYITVVGEVNTEVEGNYSVTYKVCDKDGIEVTKTIVVKVEYAKEDVNRDGAIDIEDVALLANNYNKKIGEDGWNSNYDLNNDDIIDIFDIVNISKKM